MIVLGSRSPRRRELLAHLVPPERVRVLPPRSSDEPGFDGCHDWPAIESRLREIVALKADDVLAQLDEAERESSLVLVADTVIVGTESDGSLRALGQPPEDASWPNVVRDWFRRYYLGRTHTAATAVRIVGSEGAGERVVRTEVAFDAAGERWLDWYVATGEPRGKAGGYALQGAGEIFAERVTGSPSNVVGLPLRETAELLAELRGTDFQPDSRPASNEEP